MSESPVSDFVKWHIVSNPSVFILFQATVCQSDYGREVSLFSAYKNGK